MKTCTHIILFDGILIQNYTDKSSDKSDDAEFYLATIQKKNAEAVNMGAISAIKAHM